MLKRFQLSKGCSFELSIHQIILEKNVSWFQQKYEAAPFFNIDNNK